MTPKSNRLYRALQVCGGPHSGSVRVGRRGAPRLAFLREVLQSNSI